MIDHEHAFLKIQNPKDAPASIVIGVYDTQEDREFFEKEAEE